MCIEYERVCSDKHLLAGEKERGAKIWQCTNGKSAEYRGMQKKCRGWMQQIPCYLVRESIRCEV